MNRLIDRLRENLFEEGGDPLCDEATDPRFDLDAEGFLYGRGRSWGLRCFKGGLSEGERCGRVGRSLGGGGGGGRGNL